MDMCELYGCGSGSLWTREDLDELWGDADEILGAYGIWITSVFVKKEKGRDILDVEYHYTSRGVDSYSFLKEVIAIDAESIQSPREFVETYTPILAEAIRKEVDKAIQEEQMYG